MREIDRKNAKVEQLRAKVLDYIDAQVDIATAAAKAPHLSNEEACAEMTTVEQIIARHASLPPAEAPMYLHAAMRVLASATKSTMAPDENIGKSPVFQVVGTLNVNAWQASYDAQIAQEKAKESAILLEAAEAEKEPVK